MKNTGHTENNQENLPKKRKGTILVIGHVDHGKTTLTAAMTKALASKVGEEIIVVDSVEKLQEVTGVELSPEQVEIIGAGRTGTIEELSKPEPLTFRARPVVELPSAQIHYNTESNPWPSKKGRKGKRRW